MEFSSGMLAGQSSTVISWSANHLEVVLALWAGAKVLLEKEISITIKLVSRWKHKVLISLFSLVFTVVVVARKHCFDYCVYRGKCVLKLHLFSCIPHDFPVSVC